MFIDFNKIQFLIKLRNVIQEINTLLLYIFFIKKLKTIYYYKMLIII